MPLGSRSINAAITTVYSSDRQVGALSLNYLRLRHVYTAIMSMFRSKKLDLGGFVNIKVIRDHTKRKVFEQNETERSVEHPFGLEIQYTDCVGYQTSTPVHHPQHSSATTRPRPGSIAIVANALLHPSHPDQEQMYCWRQGKRCFP